MAGTYAIETTNLCKSYAGFRGFRELIKHPLQKKGTLALDGVSLRVKRGEIFGLLGENGAGKTTLIKVLCTLLLPNSGTAKVNGFDVVNEGQRVKESIGLVNCEERSFFWRLNGRQNLEFFAALHNLGHAEAKERAAYALDVVGLTEKADELYCQYSSGMKQRLSIARGLLNNPEILLMDDPFVALDPNIARKTGKFIKGTLAGKMGKTVFFATHNLREAEKLCSRVAVLHHGKIAACNSLAAFGKRGGIEKAFGQATGDGI
ncbi:MAG: ABC transporter ATP-binding protein [Candidatus Diapherotrites archaeon]